MKAKPSEHSTRRSAPFLAISFGFAVLLSSTDISSAANQASGEAPGYLDLDNVRVTVVGSGDAATPVNR